MARFFRFFLSIMLLVLPAITHAQNPPVEMADSLRRDGKIYIVVIVIFTIFIGLVWFLFSLERRIKKIENQHKNK